MEKIKVSKNVVEFLQNYVEENGDALKEETNFILEEYQKKVNVYFNHYARKYY